MCKELRLKLSRKRPTFYVGNVKCLYDSGAMFPVWCGSYELLFREFPRLARLDKKFILSGFGGAATIEGAADVYQLPEFVLTDGECAITFRNLCIAVIEDSRFGCDFILSDQMFSKMSCCVNRLNEEEPYLEIKCTKDLYYVRRIVDGQHDTFVKGLCNFAQVELEESCVFE